MKIIRNIIVAFSLYSKIPVPIFEWKEDDMKHNLVFLPWIGALIGGIIASLSLVFRLLELPELCKGALYSLVPLFVTGGFHLDGFMDVQDALKSYKPKEEKLKILKDPHIGAFSVIKLLEFAIIWAAAMSVLLKADDKNAVYVFAAIFFEARAAAGILSLTLKHAKKDGMLNMETEKMGRRDLAFLIMEAALGAALMIYLKPLTAAIAIAGLLIFCLYYKQLCYKELGGVTGDTSGYFITAAEEIMLVLIAVGTYF